MLNIVGQLFGTSGYAQHTRYLANALNKLTDCSIQTNLHPNWERDVNDVELKMLKRETDYDTNLIITHPSYWRVNCNAKRNICYLIWEGDKVPQWILDECDNPNIDKIICPSTHTYNAVMNTDSNKPVNVPFKDKFVIIPHGVDTDIFHPIPKGL